MAQGKQERSQAGVEDGWVKVGSVGAAHGVRGDVRLKSFTAEPAAIFGYSDLRLGAGGAPVNLKKVRKTKDGFVAHIDGIDSPEAVAAVKAKGLYAARDVFSEAEEDEFFLADLIGLTAVDLNKTRIGTVATLDNFGAEDLLELVLDEPVKGLGRHVFIPFRKALVPNINVAEGFIVIDFASWQAIQTSERDIEGLDSEGEK